MLHPLPQALADDDGSDGPPPLPIIPKLLNFWQFDDTNLLGSEKVFPPKAASNLVLVSSWETNAVEIASPGALLQYQTIETNAAKNLTCAKGTIYWWLLPYWNSGDGSGPGSYARLFEIGTYTTNASIGWLSLYFDPYGSNVFFGGQTNGAGATFLTAPVSLTSNTWMFFALTWSSTNSTLFTNGVVAATGSGAAYYPGATVRSNGFCLGGDSTGQNLINGQLEWCRTYDGPVPDNWPLGFYNLVLQRYGGDSGGGNFGMLSGGLYGEMDGGCITNGPVYLTNLTFVTNAGGSLKFSIAGGTNGVAYDVFQTTRLVGTNLTNSVWTWLGQGYTCYNYTLTNQTNLQAFLVLGDSTFDPDGDGLSTSFERLISRTDPAVFSNPDTDGDGIPDRWEIGFGTNPLADDSAQTGQRTNYSYDPAGRLKQVTGKRTETLTLDAEGNVKVAQ